MPLNHVAGEQIEGLDPIYRVVPLAKYQEQTRLTTQVMEMSTGKFRREVARTRPIWQAALNHAMMSFAAAGTTPGALAYDCIAQEYPRTGMVAFIFNATVNGAELFVTAPFALGQQQIADLTLRNLWQPYTIN